MSSTFSYLHICLALGRGAYAGNGQAVDYAFERWPRSVDRLWRVTRWKIGKLSWILAQLFVCTLNKIVVYDT